jgi:hypothetical protein
MTDKPILGIFYILIGVRGKLAFDQKLGSYTHSKNI